MKRISDNPSAKGLLGAISLMSILARLMMIVPSTRRILPKGIIEELRIIKEQARAAARLPDQFNDVFSKMGWIAYDSMDVEIMHLALSIEKEGGILEAEQALADHYNEKTLKFWMTRFSGHEEFRKRLRLIKLAETDYLAGRYHACTPLLLALMDGLVGDISRRVGFFAENSNVTAWDSIVGHENGLSTLAKIMSLKRKRTNEDAISIPYRNGILHGRELAFDNHIVAAKSWAALFAIRDWADAINKDRPSKLSWRKIREDRAKLKEERMACDAWRPRELKDIVHLPHSKWKTDDLPINSPERAVADFLDNWCERRFGPMAEWLIVPPYTSIWKYTKSVRQDFGERVPTSYRIISVTDSTPAMSEVTVEIHAVGSSDPVKIPIHMIYHDAKGCGTTRGMVGWQWKLIQANLISWIYDF